MLEELLEAYARGETDAQHALLEEVEPLLFGMARSLVPSGPDSFDRAVALTHALTLAFHLEAGAGRVTIEGKKNLRAYAHRQASRKLADAQPLLLSEDVADEETGSLVYKCLGLGIAVEDELSTEELAEFVARLEGRAAAEGWRERLERAGIVRRA